jgi:uncharacterized protein
MLITDPWFYALAIPAVLLMGVSKSGFASGLGSLATPLVALSVSAPQAAAIMLPLLLVMDMTGLKSLWKERDPALLRQLLPAGLLGTVVGTLLFGLLSPQRVAAVVGVLTLLMLAQRLLWPPKADAKPPPLWVGWGLATTSGFTSFVAHAGGPPMQLYLLPLKLSPLRFAATSAVFFAAINLSKWIPYAVLGLIDLRNLLTSAVLMPLAPLGVWAGLWAARRVDAALFYRLIYVGMFLTGVKLVWDGLR